MATTLSYGFKVLRDTFRYPFDTSCPYCNTRRSVSEGRKRFLLRLRRCPECNLLFRLPKDSPGAASRYYERGYQEHTVDAPSTHELQAMLAQDFRGTRFDRGDKVNELLKWIADPAGAKVLDYGASFGYVVRQMHRAGLNRALGFEISRTRADYGQKHLGVQVVSDWSSARASGPFDAICAIHVIEHLPRPAMLFDECRQLLRPGARLLLWTPNAGTEAVARYYGGHWKNLVGEPHPVALTYEFVEVALRRQGYSLEHSGAVDDQELFIVARRDA